MCFRRLVEVRETAETLFLKAVFVHLRAKMAKNKFKTRLNAISYQRTFILENLIKISSKLAQNPVLLKNLVIRFSIIVV